MICILMAYAFEDANGAKNMEGVRKRGRNVLSPTAEGREGASCSAQQGPGWKDPQAAGLYAYCTVIKLTLDSIFIDL